MNTGKSIEPGCATLSEAESIIMAGSMVAGRHGAEAEDGQSHVICRECGGERKKEGGGRERNIKTIPVPYLLQLKHISSSKAMPSNPEHWKRHCQIY